MTTSSSVRLVTDEIIYQAGSIKLTVSRTLDPKALRLLQQTIYGTTGVRYQHSNQAIKVRAVRAPLFFQLWQDAQLIGMYCLDERTVNVGLHPVSAFYGRYLTVDPLHSGKQFGRLLKRQAIDFVNQRIPTPLLFYSYIEENNSRSMAISSGEAFQSIALLKTYFFRRYTPQADARVSPANESDLLSIRPLLDEYYKAYSFRTFDHIGYQGYYFVLKEGDVILAGIQANPVCWRFMNMPGLVGAALMNLAPLLSVSRRFFNPAQQSFAVLEGLYLAPGHQDLLPVLLEGMLAKLGLYSAMWEIDEKDPHTVLLAEKSMGLLSGYQKGVTTRVMVKTKWMPNDWMSGLGPTYISSFDYS